jgi:hypothetical protein
LPIARASRRASDRAIAELIAQFPNAFAPET